MLSIEQNNFVSSQGIISTFGQRYVRFSHLLLRDGIALFDGVFFVYNYELTVFKGTILWRQHKFNILWLAQMIHTAELVWFGLDRADLYDIFTWRPGRVCCRTWTLTNDQFTVAFLRRTKDQTDLSATYTLWLRKFYTTSTRLQWPGPATIVVK
jgi:hypothetical protein